MKLKTLKSTLRTVGPTIRTLGASWRTTGITTGQRGYNYRWQQARARHLRNSPLCVMCEAEGRVELATVVDHRVPHRGDQARFWDETNWQSLCATHHSSHKQRQEREDAGHGIAPLRLDRVSCVVLMDARPIDSPGGDGRKSEGPIFLDRMYSHSP